MKNVIKRAAMYPMLRQRIPGAVFEAHRDTLGWRAATAHQMLGFFHSTQDARPFDDSMVPLLNLSADNAASMMFGDMGEIQFFIDEESLARRDFDSAVAQLQSA